MEAWMDTEQASGRLEAYRLFTTLLLSLPDEQLVRGVAALGQAGAADGAGAQALAEFACGAAGRPEGDVLQQIAIDRAWLLRNVKDDGPLPPYETAYAGGDARANIAALNIAYADAGFLVSKSVHETPDYIGVELSFMQSLIERQVELVRKGAADEARALYETQVRFWEAHLGTWAPEFAEKSAGFARTGFYQAVFQMLQQFCAEESQLLAGCA